MTLELKHRALDILGKHWELHPQLLVFLETGSYPCSPGWPETANLLLLSLHRLHTSACHFPQHLDVFLKTCWDRPFTL